MSSEDHKSVRDLGRLPRKTSSEGLFLGYEMGYGGHTTYDDNETW